MPVRIHIGNVYYSINTTKMQKIGYTVTFKLTSCISEFKDNDLSTNSRVFVILSESYSQKFLVKRIQISKHQINKQ